MHTSYARIRTKFGDKTMTAKKRTGWKKFAILLILVLGAVVLTACFGTQVTIAFNSDGGSACETIIVTSEMTEITLPVPAKDGCNFDGWYANRSFTTPVPAVLSSDNIPTMSVTYYAKWSRKRITIKFAVENEVIGTKIFDYDETVTEADCPPLDAYPDYAWEKFSFKANYDRQVDAKKVHNVEPEYTVAVYFPTDDGYVLASAVKGVKGTVVPDPGKPTYVGHENTAYFSHWALDEAGNRRIEELPTEIGDADVKIYAIFKDITDGSKFLFYEETADGKSVSVTGLTQIGKYQDTVSIPKLINGKPVVSVGDDGEKGSVGSKFLQTVVIPETVKEIKGYAFFGSESLKEVIFVGNALTSIGEGAFANCSSIVKLDLPNNVTSIGDYAFAALTESGITKLKNGETPDESETVPSLFSTLAVDKASKLSHIGDYAFYGCSKTETARFGTTMRDFNYLAFYGSGIREIDFYDGGLLKGIDGAVYSDSGEKLFYFPIKGDESYEMPQTVTEIAPHAFYRNEGIKKITVSSVLAKVGDYAFYGCASLTEANFASSSLVSVGDYAFYDCAALTRADFPATLTATGASAFENCGSLKNVNFNGDKLKEIKTKTFYRCGELERAFVPADVKEIGDYAYAYCGSLNRLTFGRGSKLEVIGDYAFYGSPKITTTLIPGGTQRIGAYAFASENGKSQFELDTETNLTNLNEIGDYAFMNTSISSFTIAENVKNVIPSAGQTSVNKLGKYVFKNCTNLKQAYFTPTSEYVSISEGLFYGCASLGRIRFTNKIKEISDYAFYNCSSLKSVSDWQKVEKIGSEAFYGCVSLENNGGEERVLPRELVSLGERAFYNCKSLEIVNVSKGLVNIPEEAFSHCEKLETISYDADGALTTIGENAFSYCTSLKTATLPVKLAEREYAEYDEDGKVTNVVNDTTGLIKNPFYGCSSLTAYVFAGDTDGTLTAEDGVVYRSLSDDDANAGVLNGKNARAIYAYPTAKSTAFYEVPVWASEIDRYAFFGSTITGIRFADASEQNGKKPIMFTEVGDYAFAETAATEASISARVYKIGVGAFARSKLNSVTVDAKYVYASEINSAYNVLNAKTESNLLTIGADAFKQTAIKRFAVPYRVTELGDGALSECYSLSEITFGEGAKIDGETLTLGDGLFRNDNLISAVVLPDNVVAVGAYAFYACANLEKVTFGFDGTENLAIGDYAFAKAQYLYEITFPSNLASLGKGVFDGDTRLKYVNFATKAKDGIELEIPDYAFVGMREMEEITLPSYVTRIGEGAFNDTSLRKIEFLGDKNSPSLVIGKGAFANLIALTTIDLPANLTEIGEEAFYKSSIAQINYGEGKKDDKNNEIGLALGKKAFSGTQITEFIATARITAIGESCFENCLNLATVGIGVHVTELGDRAFYGNTALTTVTFGEETVLGTTCNPIKVIGKESFFKTGITALKLTSGDGKNGIKVKEDAFAFTALESVEIGGKGKVEIETGAFRETTALNSFKAETDDKITVGKSVFFACRSLVSLSLKGSAIELTYGFAAGATEIGDGFAFEETDVGNKNYFFDAKEKVLFDKDKTAFVYYPAGKTGATFTLDENVTEIKPYAFYGADGLTGIIVKGDAVGIGENCFTETGSNLTFYVPSDKVAEYKNGWRISNVAADETVADGLVLSVLSSGEYSVVGYLGTSKKVEIKSRVTGADGKEYFIVSVGKNAFGNNSVITEVVIEDGIKTIESYAFGNCTALTKLTIGENVTSIKNHAFFGCSSLKEITITEGSSLIEIGNYAFAGNVAMETLKLPDGVEKMGIFAFAGDTSLRDLTIGYGLEEVGNNAFENCISLNYLTLPETVKKLGSYVFTGCENLVYVEFSAQSVCKIESNTFTGAPESVYFFVPDTSSARLYKTDGIWRNHISKILSAKERCSEAGFENYVVKLDGNDYVLVAYLGTEEEVVVESTVNENVKITVVGEYAFGKFTKKITINGGVKEIADRAFYQTVNLEEITLPETVEKIGSYAFAYLKNLNKVTVVDADGSSVLSEIGAYAFSGCGRVSEFYFPASVKKIGSYAFGATDGGLSKATFAGGADNTVEIGSYAFSNNARLTDVTINARVSALGDGAFNGCVNLSALYLGYSPKDVRNAVASVSGKGVFGECEKLSVFVATENIAKKYAEIWENAYDKHKISPVQYKDVNGFVYAVTSTQSKQVTVVNYVGKNKEIVFPTETQIGSVIYSVARIGRARYDNSGISEGYVINDNVKKVVVPKSVTTIGEDAFKNSENLEEVELTSGLLTIKTRAFENCKKLTKIKIPASVTTIETYAFAGCESLNDGFSFAEYAIAPVSGTLIIGGYAFSGCVSLETLYVPSHVANIGGYRSATTKDTGHTFENCISLKTVTFSKNALITSVEGYVFANTAIEEIQLPASLETVGDYAFAKMNSLLRVVIARAPTGGSGIGNITSAGNNVFDDVDNPHLKIYVPEEVYEVYAASGWKTKTVIKNKVISTANGEFAYETRDAFITLTDYRGTDEILTIPTKAEVNNLTYTVSGLGRYFANRNVKKIKFATASQLTELAAYAFANSTGLEEIRIPDGVTVIGEYAFANCTSLKDVKLPEGLTEIKDFTFTQCVALREITLPEKVQGIGASAFSYCTGLSRVTIKFGEDITVDNARNAIGNSAFTEAGKMAGGMTIIVRDDKLTAFRAWDSVKEKIYGASNAVGDYVVTLNDKGNALILVQYLGKEKEVDLTTLTLKGLKIESISGNAVSDPNVKFIVDKKIKIPDDLKDRVVIKE